jgi:hypothetical protein
MFVDQIFFIHSSTESHLGWFQSGTVNRAVINVGVQVSFCYYDFISFGNTLSSGIWSTKQQMLCMHALYTLYTCIYTHTWFKTRQCKNRGHKETHFVFRYLLDFSSPWGLVYALCYYKWINQMEDIGDRRNESSEYYCKISPLIFLYFLCYSIEAHCFHH